MAYPVAYNKNLHDIYTFSGDPVIDPSDFRNNTYLIPNGYNNNLFINDPAYGLTYIDFSGVRLRYRGAPNFAWFDNADLSGFTWSGVGFSGGNTVIPNYPLQHFRGYVANPNVFNSPEGNTLYLYGNPLGDFSVASDYKFYNNAEPAAILISPKHVLVSGHEWAGRAQWEIDSGTGEKRVGYNLNPEFKWQDGLTYLQAWFLGKNGQTYGGTAYIKFALGNDFTITNGSLGFGPFWENNWPSNWLIPNNYLPNGYKTTDVGFTAFGGPLVLFELENQLNEEALNQVKIYKLVNSTTYVSNTPVYQCAPQGFVFVKRQSGIFDENGYGTNYFNPNNFPNASYPGFKDVFGTGQETINATYVWFGDSGTPYLMYHPALNETCFITFAGDGLGYPNFAGNATTGRIAFEAVRQYIFDEIGYWIGTVDYSQASEAIMINEKMYALGATLSSNTGTGGMTYFIGGLTSGSTYSFIVTAYNSHGYSGYAGPTGMYIS